ncbi:MAG: four helix bundle protein [Nitrospira sp.]|nr:four helix bundle protein [Nitrospira sp.]MBX3343604.1 four helix bundle protein [Nitrospira sp.]HNC84429.1 four helix bundle protein [Nitrospira sp.]HNG54583.1 four helix bundle protein [Nitrospira sp.]
MEKIRNFRDLEIWKLGKNIVLDVYRVTKAFPKEEIYGLVSQMRRAAISIPSNIAEGFNRKHNAEYRQFLYVALGSCAELETHVEIAQDLTFITVVQRDELLEQLDHESKMVRSLIKRL